MRAANQLKVCSPPAEVGGLHFQKPARQASGCSVLIKSDHAGLGISPIQQSWYKKSRVGSLLAFPLLSSSTGENRTCDPL